MPPRKKGTDPAAMRKEEEKNAAEIMLNESGGDQYQSLQKVVLEYASTMKSLAATVKEMQEENKLLKEEVAKLKKDMQKHQGFTSKLDVQVKTLNKDALGAFRNIQERVLDLEEQEEQVGDLIEEKMAEKEKEVKRKCQIRITGIEEKEKETPLILKKQVEELLEEKMKVVGGGSMMVDVFRVGKKGGDKRGRPRIIVARFGSEWQRNQVLKGKPNLREWKMIGVDFDRSPEEIEELRDELKKRWEKKKATKDIDVSKATLREKKGKTWSQVVQ